MNKEEQKKLITEIMNEDAKDSLYTLSSVDFVPQNHSFYFFLKSEAKEPIIVINEKGFYYRDELIEDAGEVYRLFKDFLVKSNYGK